MHGLFVIGLAVVSPAAAQQDTSTVDTIIRMSQVVVSASRIEEVELLDQPLAISYIEPRITNISRGTVAADLLRDVGGVHVQQTSAGQGAVVLRGLIGNQVLLLVNGIPLNNSTYRDGPGQYLATIDPETIERIEVIRGPASVLYGSDAQGGVINVITKSHPDAGRRSVRVAGRAMSANESYRGRLSGGAMGSTWSFGIGGSLGTAGDLRPGGGLGPQDPTGFDVAGVDAAFSFSSGDKHSLQASLQHFEMSGVPRYDRYVDFRAPVPGRDWEHTFSPQTRQLGYVRYKISPGSRAVMSLETTASLAVQREGRNRVKLLDPGVPDSSLTHWRDDVFTPGLAVVGLSQFPLGERTLALTWGGDIYHDQLKSNGAVTNLNNGDSQELLRQTETGTIQTGRFPNGATSSRAGLFLAADWEVMRQWRISLGGRWGTFRNVADVGTELGGRVENTSSSLTGQLGIVFHPIYEWSIAFRLAEGFRAPNLYDLTNVGPIPAGQVLPNVNVKPEKSLSTELGVRYAGSDAAFELTVYYTRISDFIDRVPGSFRGDTLFNGERIFTGQNVGTARMGGLEAEGILRMGQVEGRATLLYTRGDQTDGSGVETPLSKIPPLGGTAGLRWTSENQRFWVDYGLSWAIRQDRLGLRDETDPRICPQFMQDTPDLCGTDGFFVHGISAGAEITPAVVVSAGLDNISDTLYRTHASGVDSAGRSVWVGVSALGVL
ncbi:MAG: TonB-dependent receptor [Gemmatimonadota bacterium]|nr:MAG: TonB-dependent receptor [Gemmatimonadota bacterium]